MLRPMIFLIFQDFLKAKMYFALELYTYFSDKKYMKIQHWLHLFSVFLKNHKQSCYLINNQSEVSALLVVLQNLLRNKK